MQPPRAVAPSLQATPSTPLLATATQQVQQVMDGPRAVASVARARQVAQLDRLVAVPFDSRHAGRRRHERTAHAHERFQLACKQITTSSVTCVSVGRCVAMATVLHAQLSLQLWHSTTTDLSRDSSMQEPSCVGSVEQGLSSRAPYKRGAGGNFLDVRSRSSGKWSEAVTQGRFPFSRPTLLSAARPSLLPQKWL